MVKTKKYYLKFRTKIFRVNITQDEKDKINKQQKEFDKMIKSRQRHMIMAYQIKRRLEKVYKRTMIYANAFEALLEKK